MPPKKKEPEAKILLGRPKGNLRMGLVGLPNVGKSTTFNLLCKQAVPAENFPFCTIDPHEARMNVPDTRFKWLCEHYKPKSEVPATLTIYDIAGLVPGAHEGEGLGNAFLSHIQGVDGIYHVLRAFESDEIVHTQGEVNPIDDLETISNELRLKDVERCKARVDDYSKTVARGHDKSKAAELVVLKEVLEHLESGKWISAGRNWTIKEVEVLNDHQFLTAKPVVYLVNLSQADFMRQKNKWLAKIHKWVQDNLPGPIIPFSAEFEAKLAEFETDEERADYIKSVGAQKSMIDKIITTGYSTLHLIHYFTSGEDEVKCWTIREGTKAPQAAGIIHTDMERGFICAEVTKFDDLVEKGNDSAVKAAGKVYTKGKEYVMEDGDIVFYKFNPSGGKK
eukprot:Gregarina_sp_Pseudo_9__1324@NODE_1887_length_1275_cov_13_839806_g1751_i0_p1_GENE_NODE_1887_length_1275_cov_13_839806_g1751_i0NODE_1887_length_1275_cov_13_839806_g1751_i0_p1_ORF_typecomplete_len400_score128_48YchFGTPase_C/PF06071_13/5_9e02YchFGTPase_C/PF06071_13/4_7e39MMR_HSR1/PF01926_23/7_5e28MMR_HSR1/PF01926_23/7_1e03FeoB_N/PF02421_18/1_5e07FeoB_N/PF02421_18/5_7e02Roc/PF08477_13/0_063Roc/PF08477_13/4_1e02AAA/PF00004_29/0_056MnmE_helical/PF12631_7/0_064DUF87/PF01935_17/0_15DUF87/PF01935_17/5_8e0